MKKKIIANFKMNQTIQESKAYFTKLISKFENDKIELIVCPPFTSISIAGFFAKGTSIKIGGQNLSDEEFGGQTGEISAKMLKDAGVEYVIIGHSERRTKFKENNLVINKKIKTALKTGLKPILCVGETISEKIAGKTVEVLRKQVEEGIRGLYENELESLIIAYEPVWAIGTGKFASVKDIEDGCNIVRKTIQDLYSDKAGRDICVIYGGGLNSVNSGKILMAKGIDGGLFGKSSLDVDSFVSILNKIK